MKARMTDEGQVKIYGTEARIISTHTLAHSLPPIRRTRPGLFLIVMEVAMTLAS